jgi:hypothetical protein
MKAYKTPDYSKYTLKELEDVYYVVDRKRYPDNFRAIVEELEKRKSKIKIDKSIVLEKTASDKPEADTMLIAPAKTLPVIDIMKTAFSVSWFSKFKLLRTLIIPYLIIVALEAIQPLIVLKVGMVAGSGLRILKLIVYALFAVSCHRLILLGDTSIPKFGLIIPGKREFRFWGWTVLIGICIMIVTGVIFVINAGLLKLLMSVFDVYIPPVIDPIIFLLVAYVTSRLSLIFPAIAIDKHPNFDWAWNQSRNNGWRLFVLIVLPLVSISGIHYLIKDESSLFLNGLVVFFSFSLTVLGIIFISLSYKELCLQDGTNKINKELTI